MSMKDRLRRQLESSRNMSEKMLADFKTPQQWTHQVFEGGNHALWFAGHVAYSDNFFLSLVAPEKTIEKEGYGNLFGMGSHPTGNAEDYPPVDEVLSFMRERRQALLDALEEKDEESFNLTLPDGTPDFLSDIASVFETAIWHEGMHCGQLSVVRRALGHRPVMSAPQTASYIENEMLDSTLPMLPEAFVPHRGIK